MFDELKIGDLVPCVVLKALPDYDAMLVMIVGTDKLAKLPKKYSGKKYRVGMSLVAAINSIENGWIIVTQKSHQFYRKVVELAFSELIDNGKLKVKRVATVANSGFAKVSVERLNGIDPLQACVPLLKNIQDYTDDTITLVEYKQDIKEYIASALRPAPAEKIKKVIYLHGMKEAEVMVEEKYIGKFMGKGGVNVATAAKLIHKDMKIFIKKARD